MPEQLKLKQVRAACPHLDALRGHVEEFAKMLTGRHGSVSTHGSPPFALTTYSTCTPSPRARARSRRCAGRAHLAYSSGAVEGKVGKIKFLKRLMFGRASYDLLRKMALLN